MKLTALYVNYNTTAMMLDSIRSLKANLPIKSLQLIVVDNASDDFTSDTVKKIKTIYPQAKIINSSENLGFAKGNNLAIDDIKGEYVWLVNTDTLVPADNHLDKLIKFLDGHAGYAAASPLLVHKDGTVQTSQVAVFPNLTRVLLIKPAQLISKILPFTMKAFYYFDEDLQGTVERDVDVAVGASLFIRTSVFREVGGFTSDYFMYYDDPDLCRKFHEAGYKVRFFTSSKMIHFVGGSYKDEYLRKKLYFQSQDIYFKRWFGSAQLWILKIFRLPLILFYKFKYSK